MMRAGWAAVALAGLLGITPKACTPMQKSAPADAADGGLVGGTMGRHHEIRRACPTCGRRYHRSKTVCPHDGTSLVER